MSAQQQSKQVRFKDGHKVLQQVSQNTIAPSNSSRVSSAISELRASFNEKAGKLSVSRVSEQLNESVQTIARSPGPCCSAPICIPQQMQMCQPNYCQQQQAQTYVVANGNQDNSKLEKEIKKLKKKNKKLKEEKETVVSTIAVTPRRQKAQKIIQQDPEIDSIKREIIEMERIIKQMEQQPRQSQQEIELYVEDNKKCLKKMCKKVKALEKELYDVARQRDEALIIKTQLERENQDMFDRIGELESVLKVADKKVFDLTVQVERQNGYIKQLEDEVERLRRKKKKKQVEVQERIVEKFIDKPMEIVKNVTVEKRVEVPVEIIREVPVDRIVEKIIEIPRIEYVYQQVPQYIETPVVQRVEVPVEVPYEVVRQVPYEVIRDVPYEVVRDVPYEVYRDVPYEVIKYIEVPQYIEVPVDRIVEKIVEVPVDRIVEVPVDRIVEVPYEVRVPYEVHVPYDRVVEVPYENRVEIPRDRIVEVPVDRVVEVPVDRIVDRWHTDERELKQLDNENRDLRQELEYIRDKLRIEIERSNMHEEQQIEYLRSQILALEVGIRNAQMDQIQWEDRSVKLENELHKERTIVSDLQNRLDQMYYQVEVLTADNNKKNEDFQRYLEKLDRRHKKELHQASQPTVVQHYLLDQGSEGNVQMQIGQVGQSGIVGQQRYGYGQQQDQQQRQQSPQNR